MAQNCFYLPFTARDLLLMDRRTLFLNEIVWKSKTAKVCNTLKGEVKDNFIKIIHFFFFF